MPFVPVNSTDFSRRIWRDANVPVLARNKSIFKSLEAVRYDFRCLLELMVVRKMKRYTQP